MLIDQHYGGLHMSATVFYVEGVSVLHEVYSNFLKNHGYDVLSFVNGEDVFTALEVAKHCDLIITNYTLQGRANGLAVLRTIRNSNAWFRNVPIIVFTEEVCIEAPVKQAGGVFLLQENNSYKNLMRTMDYALSQEHVF